MTGIQFAGIVKNIPGKRPNSRMRFLANGHRDMQNSKVDKSKLIFKKCLCGFFRELDADFFLLV